MRDGTGLRKRDPVPLSLRCADGFAAGSIPGYTLPSHRGQPAIHGPACLNLTRCAGPPDKEGDAMNASKKMQWLRRVLLVKVIVTVLLWGLPSLIGTPEFAALFGIEMPQDPIFMRMFGAVVTAFGVAYWLPLLPVIFLFLFLAVLIPCCLSDIVFPLLFIGKVATLEHITYNHHGGK